MLRWVLLRGLQAAGGVTNEARVLQTGFAAFAAKQSPRQELQAGQH